MNNLAFDLLVLCGGQGRRMQGQDKPLLSYQGKPMVESIVNTVPTGTRVLISANRNHQQYSRWGEVFDDRDVDNNNAMESPTGPLTGILGGLERGRQDWLLVSPGDTPCLPFAWYEPLIAAANDAGAVIFDGIRQQHLHLLLSRHLHTSLRNYLQSGHHRVWQWLDNIDIATAEVARADWFSNINTPADLES